MKTRSTHKKWTKNKKNTKNIRVLAQGTFDLLHPGHVHYLHSAKKFGTHLTVIIARDDTVKRVKHHDPMFDEQTRLKQVSAVKHVDCAVLGGKGNILDKVVELRPDVIVLGYDQNVSVKKLKEQLRERGLSCKIVRATAHFPSKFKSTKLKEKMALKSENKK